MLDIAVTFLADELNSYLRKRGVLKQQELVIVTPSPLVNDRGDWQIAKGKIGITLINIEEERVLREQLPERSNRDGNQVTLQPPLKLNLTLLFAVGAGQAETGHKTGYIDSLKSLSHVLTFFQANQTFSSLSHPGLDARIAKLNAELLSYTPEQLNQTWAYLGSKYLPSAIYRIRMVLIQDSEPLSIDKPITGVGAQVERR